MGKKYIIELEEAPFIQHFDIGIDETIYRVKGFNSLVFDWNGLQMLTPYTETDMGEVREEAYEQGKIDAYVEDAKNITMLKEEAKEAYQRGYDDAKHECTDCQKIMMDAEQERADKAYQQGLEDARNRKATCEFCEYAGNDESDEPCVRCCCGYMNMFRPKREPKQIEFGDELRSRNNPNIRVLVTNVRGSKWDGIAISEVIDSCRFGSSYSDRNLDGWEKTGRNFASALQDMMNEKF